MLLFDLFPNLFVKENIQLIYEEALRKYNNIREIADSHDKKAATLLGFIGILVGILVGDFPFSEVIYADNHYGSLSLLLGLFFLFLSFSSNCCVLWTRKIYTGAKVKDLIDLYETEEVVNFKKIVIAKLVKAEIKLSGLSIIKAKYLKFSILSLGISLMFLILTKLLI